MKKVFLSLILSVGIAGASELSQQDINKAFCDGMQVFLDRKATVAVGIDTFTILHGKETKCEDHTPDEWKALSNEQVYGILIGLKYGLPCAYSTVVDEIKKSGLSDGDAIRKLLTEKHDSIAAVCKK